MLQRTRKLNTAEQIIYMYIELSKCIMCQVSFKVKEKVTFDFSGSQSGL